MHEKAKTLPPQKSFKNNFTTITNRFKELGGLLPEEICYSEDFTSWLNETTKAISNFPKIFADLENDKDREIEMLEKWNSKKV